jgi:hypothetical protein
MDHRNNSGKVIDLLFYEVMREHPGIRISAKGIFANIGICLFCSVAKRDEVVDREAKICIIDLENFLDWVS